MPPPHALVRPPDGTPPLMLVVIDAEEEFDWLGGFHRANDAVRNMGEQWRAQAILDAVGVVPLYAIDYPVATDDAARDWLSAQMAAGRAEIGAHLHPWVNPPHKHDRRSLPSYAGALPLAEERDKLAALTDMIAARFGRRPIAYKAGRYGIGPNTPGILRDLGYRLDLSVAPHSSFAGDGGPVFYGAPEGPWWLDVPGGVLEVPTTTGFAGALARWGARAAPLLDHGAIRALHLPGLLARAGLLERTRLSPEYAPPAALRRLMHAMVARGERVFTLSYHSASLLPGATPYAPDATARDRLLETLALTLRCFRDEIGGSFIAASALDALLRGQSAKH